jgi:hypothetical protein
VPWHNAFFVRLLTAQLPLRICQTVQVPLMFQMPCALQQQAMRGPQGAAAPSAPSQTGSLGGLKGKAAAAAAPPSSDSMAEGQGSNQPSGKKSTNAKKKKKSKF